MGFHIAALMLGLCGILSQEGIVSGLMRAVDSILRFPWPSSNTHLLLL